MEKGKWSLEIKAPSGLNKKNKIPNLFIIGPPRCSTTSLYHYLKGHPDIYMSPVKEPRFFVDFEAHKTVKNVAEYLNLFSNVKNEKIIGEASPDYIYSPNAPKKIRKLNSNAKIILVKRNPNDAILSYLKMIKGSYAEKTNIPHWEIYNYEKNIKNWLKYFSRKQILILDFEDIKNDTRREYLRILEFLGVKDDGRNNFQIWHETREPRIKFIDTATSWISRKPKLKSF